jgi:hypothetical protein
MKRLVFTLFVVFAGTVLVKGQSQQTQPGPSLPGNSVNFKASMKTNQLSRQQDVPFSLVKAANPTVAAPQTGASRAFNAEQTIGRTTFDNMSNGSMMRRIVNTDGKLSVVWTFSNEEVDSFPNRGTAYNYFDGTSWVNMPAYDNLDQIVKIEPEGTRTGFASILNIPGKGEWVVAHRTDIDALQFTTDATAGSQNWNSTPMRDFPILWPRATNAGPDGKTIHLIGIALEDTIDGEDKFDGMSSALLYSRSLDGGDTWDKKNVLIPGMDSTLFTFMSGDSYAIDAKGNTVAIVYGTLTSSVVLYKSTDNGETWTRQIVKDFPMSPWKDEVTDFNNDGDVDDVIEILNMDTLYAETGTRPSTVVVEGETLTVQTEGATQFVVFNGDTIEVQQDSLIVLDKLVMVNDTLYLEGGSYVVFPVADTAYVDSVGMRKFVVHGSDTLDVQFDAYVVRQLETTQSDTSIVQEGAAYRYITISAGVTEDVVEDAGGSFIIFEGDTFALVGNTYVLLPGDTTFLSERIESNDGASEVLIDSNGKVHVWFGNMTISNDEAGDDMYTYYPGVSGIMYWNENFATGEEARLISDLVDDDGNNVWDVLLRYDQLDAGGNANSTPGPFPYGGGAGATSMPTVAVDAAGKMYLFYTALKEGEQYYYISANGSYGPSFRHIYLVTSTDNGQTWSSEGTDKFPTDVTLLEEAGFDAFTEYSFPSVARKADDFIHLTYMSDESPGIYMNVNDPNYHPLNNNRMVYLKLTPELNISTKDLSAQDAGIFAYPNPANEVLYIGFDLSKQENVSMKVSNMLGQTVLTRKAQAFATGKSAVQLDVSSLTSGIYLVNVQVGTKTYTSKVIIGK